MANNRKLQAELDRMLKKVTEGIDVFDEIWDKVYSATSQAQKEKYETDLKKEIKKLQRLRDTLKGWMAGNEFKDKVSIEGAKKKIERKMEQFKICERETKTKAYSREGLAQAEKLDPEEEKRMETRNWVRATVDKLKYKVEMAEADIEEFDGDDSKHEEVADLETIVENHKWHIEKLELVTRALDNEVVDPNDVDELKDGIEYYLESGVEPDYFHDEYLYDSLELDKQLAEKAVVADLPAIKEKKKKKEKGKKGKKSKDKDSVSTREKKEKKNAHDLLLAQQLERRRLLEEEEERRKNLQIKEELEKEELAASAAAEALQQPKSFSEVFSKAEDSPVIKPKPSPTEMKLQEPVSFKSPIISRPEQPSPRSYAKLESPVMEQQRLSTPKAAPYKPAAIPLSLNTMDMDTTRRLLQSSYLHMPDAIDADELWDYKPEFPCQTPDCFPKGPSDALKDATMYPELEIDTLFLMFFYRKGTYYQYLASKELKRRQWRFHKGEKTWFLRHQEPSLVTEDYEVGAYVYFDLDSWGQMVRENFTFEFEFLDTEIKA